MTTKKELGLEGKDYFEIDRVSASGLKRLQTSYEHYRVPTTITPAMEYGSFIHTLILEPDLIQNQYHIGTIDQRTKDGKLKAKEIEEQGKIIISEKDYETALKMQESVLNNPYFEPFGKKETEIYWELQHEGETIECKSKIDVIGEEAIIDIKTIADITKAERAVIYDYCIQAYFYQKAVETTRDKKLPFRFIFIEKTAPYSSICIECSEGTIEKGKWDADKGLTNYLNGLKGLQTLENFKVV